VARRQQWQAALTDIRRLHGWVLQAEHILSGEWAVCPEEVTNVTVGAQFDAWCARLGKLLREEACSPRVRAGLGHFLHVTQNMRPHLIQCYDMVALPRTNNDMENLIRAIKTRYRKMSGRKNWNRYLLRYGRRVAYYETAVQQPPGQAPLEPDVYRVSQAQWRRARVEQQASQGEQLKQYHFRHKRTQFLQRLEARWDQAS